MGYHNTKHQIQIMSDSPVDLVEQGFDAIGMMRGSYAPFKRAVTTMGAAALVVHFIQPKLFFVNGQARPWALLTKNPEASVIPPTNFPWYSIPIGLGLIAGVFI
jgi:hypothetical protein